jgi:hypothetical protein
MGQEWEHQLFKCRGSVRGFEMQNWLGGEQWYVGHAGEPRSGGKE